MATFASVHQAKQQEQNTFQRKQTPKFTEKEFLGSRSQGRALLNFKCWIWPCARKRKKKACKEEMQGGWGDGI